MMFSAKMVALMSLATSASMSPTPRLSEEVPSPERKEGPVFYRHHGSMLGKRPALPFGNCYPAPRGNRRTGNGPAPATDRVSTCVAEARAKLRRRLRNGNQEIARNRRMQGIRLAAMRLA